MEVVEKSAAGQFCADKVADVSNNRAMPRIERVLENIIECFFGFAYSFKWVFGIPLIVPG